MYKGKKTFDEMSKAIQLALKKVKPKAPAKKKATAKAKPTKQRA